MSTYNSYRRLYADRHGFSSSTQPSPVTMKQILQPNDFARAPLRTIDPSSENILRPSDSPSLQTLKIVDSSRTTGVLPPGTHYPSNNMRGEGMTTTMRTRMREGKEGEEVDILNHRPGPSNEGPHTNRPPPRPRGLSTARFSSSKQEDFLPQRSSSSSRGGSIDLECLTGAWGKGAPCGQSRHAYWCGVGTAAVPLGPGRKHVALQQRPDTPRGIHRVLSVQRESDMGQILSFSAVTQQRQDSSRSDNPSSTHHRDPSSMNSSLPPRARSQSQCILPPNWGVAGVPVPKNENPVREACEVLRASQRYRNSPRVSVTSTTYPSRSSTHGLDGGLRPTALHPDSTSLAARMVKMRALRGSLDLTHRLQ